MSLDITLTVLETKPRLVEVFGSNITHNLGAMAKEVGIYQHIWRPEELGITKASELIEPLRIGIAIMRADPKRFEAFDCPHGWGEYKDFLPWLERYHLACKDNPTANISVRR